MPHFVIVDEQVKSRLSKAVESLLLCAPDGTVLGTFTPTPPSKLDLQPRISEEELRRRDEDATCKLYTSAEVIAKLRTL